MPQAFVEEIRAPLVDAYILANVQRGTTAVDEVERRVREAGIDIRDIQVKDRVQQLEQTGHLRREGNNLRLTDDGREDIEKVTGWVRGLTSQQVGKVGAR
jgi:repressor of nif and glnA expression